MKTRTALVPAALFAIMLLLPSNAAAFTRNYSADMVTYANQKELMAGKIYVSGKKFRMETGRQMEQALTQAVTIVRLDKKVVWILMPQQKMYMETAMRPRDSFSVAAEKVPGEVKREYLGEESVEGRPAKKYRITYKYEGKTGTVYSWIDDALGVPIKASDEKGKWMVIYKNIKPGSQPASLFEIPEGYKKMPSFGFSPGMFEGGRGQTEEQERPAVENSPRQEKNENQGGIKLPGGIKIPKLW